MRVELPVLHYVTKTRQSDGVDKAHPSVRSMLFEIDELSRSEFEVSADNLDFGSESRFEALWDGEGHWLRETPSTNGFGRTYVERFEPSDDRHMVILLGGHEWRNAHRPSDRLLKFAMKWSMDWLASGRRNSVPKSEGADLPSTFEAELEVVRDYLTRVAIIDGYLYRRINTPYIRLDSDMEAHIHERLQPSVHGGFRLDRGLDAFAHAELFASRIRPRFDLPRIHVPEAFAWEDDAHAVASAAHDVINRVYPRTNGLTRPEFERFALSVLRPEVGFTVERLAVRLENLLPSLRMHAAAGWNEYVLPVVERAIHRWHLRPMELEPEDPVRDLERLVEADRRGDPDPLAGLMRP